MFSNSPHDFFFTCGLFTSVLFNLQIFGAFLAGLLLLISNLHPSWSENVFCKCLYWKFTAPYLRVQHIHLSEERTVPLSVGCGCDVRLGGAGWLTVLLGAVHLYRFSQ